MDTLSWQALMDSVVAEAEHESADYTPGNVMVPGDGSEGDAPDGEDYVGLGPLAFVLNEAMDSATHRGADRDSILDSIAHSAGEHITRDHVDAVLADELKCPPIELLRSFGEATSIDLGIIIDAAQRGGCEKDYGMPTTSFE